MRFGVDLANLAPMSDPRLVVRMATAAEAAGWDGVFVWDHLGFTWDAPSTDVVVALSGVAQGTDRISIGTNVLAVPRYHPVMLAQTLASIDLLSEGRLIFGAGLGAVAREFSAIGLAADLGERAALTDEALSIIDALWSGAEVTRTGPHFTIESVRLEPLPCQLPRIPVWIGGGPAALRRAACWDGWTVAAARRDGTMGITPDELAGSVSRLRDLRGGETGPFDVAITGYSTPRDDAPAGFEAAGATWWLESLHGARGGPDVLLQRIVAGPPG